MKSDYIQKLMTLGIQVPFTEESKIINMGHYKNHTHIDALG